MILDSTDKMNYTDEEFKELVEQNKASVEMFLYLLTGDTK